MFQVFNVSQYPLYRKPEKYKFEKSPVISVTGIHDFYLTSSFPVTTSVFSIRQEQLSMFPFQLFIKDTPVVMTVLIGVAA